MEKIVIIGGGAAGCIAALNISPKYSVTILEKNSVIGKKLSITGKGRCNVTFDGDFEYFKSNILDNGKFMYSSFNLLNNYDLVEFLNKLNVKTKKERGNRIFLRSDDASELVKALSDGLKRANVKIKYNSKVESVERLSCGKFKVTLSGGESEVYDRCIISTGGKSYPSTGSDGDGYKLAKELGHEVTDIRPGLVGVRSNDTCCRNMQGLTLKNVRITVYDLEKQIYQAFGEMMFAHFGITGPIVLSASSKISRIDDLNGKIKEGKINFSIDLKPALTYEALDKRICRDFLKYNTKQFKNSLKDLLPSKMINEVVIKSGIPEDKKVSGITKEERERLVYVIKNFKISVSGLMPIETGIITVGGVKLNQINPKTLESKILKNLYFIGEILDLDAYTGGFNLQIAFSTGYACAYYISESE